MLKRFFKMIGVLALVLGLGAGYLIWQDNQNRRSASDKVLEFASENLRDDQVYWLKKKNFVGQWEELILVFGYADNLSVCKFMLDYARETSPDQQFECELVR